MLKKLLSIIFALFISVSVLAGCNLVQVNDTKYYTQIVAEVEYDDRVLSFTMKDLLTAYNSYGYQSVQQGSSTVKDAINNTINSMINRAVLVEELKKTLPLTNAEKMQVRREVYANINESIAEIETQIRTKANSLPINDETTTGDEFEPLRTAPEEFKPAVILNDDNVLVKVNYDEEELEEVSDEDYIVEPFVQERNDSVAQEAYKRYISQLKRIAESEGLTGKSNQQLFDMEVERIYKVFESNKYITKFQNQYLSNENIISITADDVLQRYKDLVQRDYALYSTNISAYHAAMRRDATSIYYHPVLNQYIQITHILVKLTPEQNFEVASLKAQIGKSITQEEFDDYMETYVSNVSINYNEWNQETKEFEEEVSEREFVTAYNEIKAAVGFGNTLTEKAKAFDYYLYMFNDDPGIANRDFAYVVNLTNDYGTKNIMIDEFTFASRALGVGQVSDPVFTEFSTGEYGYHIIMNLGAVDNLVSYANLAQVTLNDLYEKLVQPSSSKTLFHVIYDNIVADKTSTRLNQIVSQVKGDVTKYEGRYKNLWS